jgi:hypothetical protein
MDGCLLCGASARDRFGGLAHEACCPHFMRGPDAGGDHGEWGQLFEVAASSSGPGPDRLARAMRNEERRPKDDAGAELVECEWCGGLADPYSTCPRSLECPDCHARPGSPCKRPSGHKASRLHAARAAAAEAIDNHQEV